MNILPLIFAFLIVFFCIASTFLKDIKSFSLIETTLNSFDHTERKVNNTIASKAYRKIKGEPTHKKERDSTPKQKNKTYFSRRSFFPPFENSKFNMEPLVKYEGELKLHPLFEPLAKMLRLLYGERIFGPEPHSEKIEYRLLEAILIKARKNPENKELAQLFPDDPALSKVYYKMLRGTNQYNKKDGVPPLGDFVTFHKDAPAIFFSFASIVLLEALFDQKVAEQISQEERQKWELLNKYYYFSKEDLQLLLSKNPTLASRYSPLESYLDFSKQIKPRKEIGGIDNNTGLSIKKLI